MNWCEYFANIEKDPTAIAPQITIGEFLQAQEHVSECQACSDSCDRVIATAPQEDLPKGSEN